MDSKKGIIYLNISTLLLIVIVLLFNSLNKNQQEYPSQLDCVNVQLIAKQMYPMNKVEIINNRMKVYADDIHYKEFELENLYYGHFIEPDQEEVLIVLKVPKENTSHQGGFYHIEMAIADRKTCTLKSPIKEFSSDQGELALYEGKGKQFIMFVGSTTFQGWTEYSGGLYEVRGGKWKKVFPVNDSFWENRRAVMGPDSLILFMRNIEGHNRGVIPDYTFEFEKELFWDKNKAEFSE